MRNARPTCCLYLLSHTERKYTTISQSASAKPTYCTPAPAAHTVTRYRVCVTCVRARRARASWGRVDDVRSAMAHTDVGRWCRTAARLRNVVLCDQAPRTDLTSLNAVRCGVTLCQSCFWARVEWWSWFALFKRTKHKETATSRESRIKWYYVHLCVRSVCVLGLDNRMAFIYPYKMCTWARIRVSV